MQFNHREAITVPGVTVPLLLEVEAEGHGLSGAGVTIWVWTSPAGPGRRLCFDMVLGYDHREKKRSMAWSAYGTLDALTCAQQIAFALTCMTRAEQLLAQRAAPTAEAA